MHIAAAIIGILLIVTVLWDVFETIVLPRSVTRRLGFTRAFYRSTWIVWSGIARRLRAPGWRDGLLAFFGPLSLLGLLALWAVIMVVAFALVQWGAGGRMLVIGGRTSFGSDLYLSGVTLFTLGFGDVTPRAASGRVIAVIESGIGFGMLAVVIGYLPVLYQAFSRREVGITLLDARAGSPPTGAELLRRHAEAGTMPLLAAHLAEWERWAAELLESHLSFPVLTFYRSQHDRESWLSALTAILDACALVRVGFRDGAPWQAELAWQAKLTFAIARHAAVDLALILGTPPAGIATDRLPLQDAERMRTMLAKAGIPLLEGEHTEQDLATLRAQYEPYVAALADRLALSLPAWAPEERAPDNWQTSAWERADHFLLPMVEEEESRET